MRYFGEDGHHGSQDTRWGRTNIRYIGSKSRIADAITMHIGPPGEADGVLIDAFAGTGAIARAMADNGWNIRANDSLKAASILTAARLMTSDTVPFLGAGGYCSAIRSLNAVEPVEGFLWRTYSPASLSHGSAVARLYFTEANAALIDGRRRQISAWAANGVITPAEETLLLADLMTAANRVSNTAGTYGCFLREWSAPALNTIRLQARQLAHHESSIEVLTGDVSGIPAQPNDVLYLDPPYTKRQYAAYYHILETIAHGDEPEVSGVTGLRPWQSLASDFCYRTRALDAIVALIAQTPAQRIHLSYSSQGHVELGALVDELARVGEVTVTWLADIGRYRPNAGAAAAGSSVSEYLIYVEKPAPVLAGSDVCN